MLDPFAPDPNPDSLTDYELEAARWHPEREPAFGHCFGHLDSSTG